MFPIRSDLTLSDLRSAFPLVSSLRYRDFGSQQVYHILCRDGVFEEPDGGWFKTDRVYLTVCEQPCDVDRHANRALFDTYRQRISNMHRSNQTSSKQSKHTKEKDLVSITVGHGHFKNGKFSRISTTNLSAVGGFVVVGPFSKTETTADDIKNAAFQKFSCVNRLFRQKYADHGVFSLVYGDGTLVDDLPDKSKKFTIEGYRNFLDPQRRYDRLRLYLCEKDQVLYNSELVEIVSDSNSSSDELPSLSPPDSRPSRENNDDTLPLIAEVIFHAQEFQVKESFPNNTSVKRLVAFVETQNLTTGDIRIKYMGRVLNSDERLMSLTSSTEIHLDVETDSPEQTTSSVTSQEPIPGHFEGDARVTDSIVEHTVAKLSSTDEPSTILRHYCDKFLLGRALDVMDADVAPEGETSCIFVGRGTILDDAISEIQSLANIRLPLEVNFYGEESEDLGGPRKEFLGLVLEKIRDEYFDDEGILLIQPNKIANKGYYVCGLLLGISAIEGGECSPMVTQILQQQEETNNEAITQMKTGLQRVGIWQLLKIKPTLGYLFRQKSKRLTVQRLMQLLTPSFSDEGSNDRQNEERCYSIFVKYTRHVAAGRQYAVTLEKILKFTTGSEIEPILGFALQPSINFTELPGSLPTASTCVNMLYLPVNLLAEEDQFEKFNLAFTSEYFGRR